MHVCEAARDHISLTTKATDAVDRMFRSTLTLTHTLPVFVYLFLAFVERMEEVFAVLTFKTHRSNYYTCIRTRNIPDDYSKTIAEIHLV